MADFSLLDISASGLSAQRKRLEIISRNIANAETTRTPGGGPYRRQLAVFAAAGPDAGAGVRVAAVQEDPSPFPVVHRPGHPDADANGNVAYPNVNPVEEMVDLIGATRSYEANVAAIQAAKGMVEKAIELGRA